MMTILTATLLFLALINYAVTDYRLSIEFAAFINNSSEAIDFPHRCDSLINGSHNCDYVVKFYFIQPQSKEIITKRFPKDYTSGKIFDKFEVNYTQTFKTLTYKIELKLIPKSCSVIPDSDCFKRSPAYVLKSEDAITAANYGSAKVASFKQGNKSLLLVLQYGCMPDFFGDKCDIVCSSRNDNLGHYDCARNGSKICRLGWTNATSNCTESASCTAGWCQNGGQCYLNHNFMKWCKCSHNFIGRRCQSVKRPCDYHACMRGVCENLNKTHRKCNCQSNWTGESCHLNTTICKSLSCANNGECEVKDNRYFCKCPPAYTGVRCEEDVNECLNTPPVCRNGGRCSNRIGGYACSCKYPWTGTHCRTCLKSGKRMLICGEGDKKAYDSLLLSLSIVGVLVFIPGFTYITLIIVRRYKKAHAKVDKGEEAHIEKEDTLYEPPTLSD